jgi:hypothetical protein
VKHPLKIRRLTGALSTSDPLLTEREIPGPIGWFFTTA